MSDFTFPYGAYDEMNASVLEVPIAFIPFFSRLWQKLQHRDSWVSREDWWRGYQVAAMLEEELMGIGLRRLIELSEGQFRLLDNALNGRQYTQIDDGFGGFTIVPEVPVLHQGMPTVPLSMRAHLNRTQTLLENLVSGQTAVTNEALEDSPELADNRGLAGMLADLQGIIDSGWPLGVGDRPATLADLLAANRVGSPAQRSSVLSLLDALSAAANIAGIFDVVKNFFAQTVDTASDGAMLVVLLASTMAQTAAMQQQANEQAETIAALERIIASLDGGGDPPATNVIEKLTEVRDAL